MHTTNPSEWEKEQNRIAVALAQAVLTSRNTTSVQDAVNCFLEVKEHLMKLAEAEFLERHGEL